MRSYFLTSTNTTSDLGKVSGENNELYSPLAVQRHGCAPKTRRVFNVEKFVSKKNNVKTKKIKKIKKKKEKIEVNVITFHLKILFEKL